MLRETPHGLDEIIHTFGSLTRGNFESANIVQFDLPYPLLYDGHKVTKGRCHRLIVENFQQAFINIKDAGLENEAKNYSGIYAARPIRGFPSHPSCHSWGIAIDLEAQKYPLNSKKRFPQPIIEAFAKAGFMYGGDFKSRLDPMHFQFAFNY